MKDGDQMLSAWSDTADLPSFEALNRDIKTDVLIIGGGMAGILCAYFLRNAGVPYVLAEANTICSGITKNTTAKITSQHGLIYDMLLRRFGKEKAKMYLDANQTALRYYCELGQKIDCNFEKMDSYVYSLDDVKKLESETAALEQIGFSAELTNPVCLPFSTAGAIKFKNQAQFHPLKFISAIAKDLTIYEHTAVQELSDHTAITAHGKIKADQIIVTTHFPFLNKHGSYFLKLYQHRSYVLALENAAKINGMYVDENETGMSFRNYRNLLLIGGGDHRTGKKGGDWQELESFAKQYYPDANVKYQWATQDCISLDHVPYIGEYSSRTPNLYVATGFNKWGMTTSMVSAMILSDLVMGKASQYAAVFSPSRTILRPQLAANALEAVTNLITPTTPRCPHLGCALKWNPAEHSWDCPCHGSRFSENGNLIDNPATGDLKK